MIPDDPFPPPRAPEQPSPATVELRRLALAASQAFGELLPGAPGDVRFEGRRTRTDDVSRDLDGIANVPSSYPAAAVTSHARRAVELARAEGSREAERACLALQRWGEQEEQRIAEEAIRRHARERRAADAAAPVVTDDKRTKAWARATGRKVT